MTMNMELNKKDAETKAKAFLDGHVAAIVDLVDNIAGKAMTELPCLALANTDEQRGKLRAGLMVLIKQAVIAKFEGGEACTGAWETDDTFVVTVNDALAPEGIRIRVALNLGETRIEP